MSSRRVLQCGVMKKRVLVIDDSPEILNVTRHLLESRGFEVSSLADDNQALPTVEKFQPDIVILDMLLTFRSGAEICHDLKNQAATKNIPIIITTGQMNHREIESHTPDLQPADAYLIKPFEFDHLLETIQKLITRN